MESPKSLTAVVHVKFHYKEVEAKPVSEADIEMVSRILDQAAGLKPELQEVLVKFAEYLNQLGEETDRQSPA